MSRYLRELLENRRSRKDGKLNQGREFLPEGRDTADEFNFNEAILIDHLVRPCEHILRNRETDLLGRSSTVVRGTRMINPSHGEETTTRQ
jgi:hypothetical protein